jgi:alkylation response protein AidB-like acyl-CoA dehydrogenase
VKFHLSSEQEALQDTVLRTIQRVCPPERRRQILEAETDFDQALWDALMDLGVGALLVGEEDGGAGLGLEDAAMVFEVLGQTAAQGPFLGHVLATWALAQGGDAALKAKWLGKLAAGEAIAATAFPTGPADGWSLEIEDGRLSGEIGLVPGADKAELLVVGVRGGLAVVEADAGVETAPVSGSDLTRRLWTLTFKDAPAVLIGSEDLGQRLLDAALVLVAADALGGAEQCLTMSVDYAKQREQFGVIIGQFQALKHQLANMALEVEPGRALVWYAAYAWDLALPDSSRVAAHAKAHLADRFVSVARGSVQAHGGIGYTWDYDLQIWFRRSIFDRAFLGSPSVHRERAAALAGW